MGEKICPECGSEMWGSDCRGYICPACGYEIEEEPVEDMQEKMVMEIRFQNGISSITFQKCEEKERNHNGLILQKNVK